MNVCVPWHVRTSKFLTSLSSIQFAAKYCNSSKLLYRLESFLCQGSQLRLARESVVIRLPNSAFETSSKATFEEVSLTWEGVKKKRHVCEKFWMSFGRHVIRVNAVNCNISLSFSLFHPNIFHQFAMWVYQKRRKKKEKHFWWCSRSLRHIFVSPVSFAYSFGTFKPLQNIQNHFDASHHLSRCKVWSSCRWLTPASAKTEVNTSGTDWFLAVCRTNANAKSHCSCIL